jgi:hypothetical protein
MAKLQLLILFLITTFIQSFSNDQNRFIDTLYLFKPGLGQNSGQSKEFFPNNVFGPPATVATKDIPAVAESDICSIGLDGEIVIGFTNHFIIDGYGDDFTIFENTFLSPISGKLFCEPAIVSVSQDGVTYYSFPFDSISLVGCAGTIYTNGSENPFDPSKSGGNSFDLQDIGLEYAKYIKIRDITNLVKNNPNHYYYDATLSGFDLDAVAGMHTAPIALSVDENIQIQEIYQISIYDINGNLIKIHNDIYSKNYSFEFSKNYPQGIYLVIFYYNDNSIKLRKICNF